MPSHSDHGILLYSGSKHFFGARNNLEIQIVSHSRYNCIEIIAYNALKGVESTPRVYLAESLLKNKILKDEHIFKINSKLEKLKQQQSKGEDIDIEMVTRAIWSFAYTRAIIGHIENDTDVPDNECRMYLDPPINDKPPNIVCHKPDALHAYPLTANDLKVTHARYNSDDEEWYLRVIMAKKLLERCIDGFTHWQQHENKTKLDRYSLPQTRWINAIRHVLFKHKVAMTKRFFQRRKIVNRKQSFTDDHLGYSSIARALQNTKSSFLSNSNLSRQNSSFLLNDNNGSLLNRRGVDDSVLLENTYSGKLSNWKKSSIIMSGGCVEDDDEELNTARTNATKGTKQGGGKKTKKGGTGKKIANGGTGTGVKTMKKSTSTSANNTPTSSSSSSACLTQSSSATVSQNQGHAKSTPTLVSNATNSTTTTAASVTGGAHSNKNEAKDSPSNYKDTLTEINNTTTTDATQDQQQQEDQIQDTTQKPTIVIPEMNTFKDIIIPGYEHESADNIGFTAMNRATINNSQKISKTLSGSNSNKHSNHIHGIKQINKAGYNTYRYAGENILTKSNVIGNDWKQQLDSKQLAVIERFEKLALETKVENANCHSASDLWEAKYLVRESMGLRDSDEEGDEEDGEGDEEEEEDKDDSPYMCSPDVSAKWTIRFAPPVVENRKKKSFAFNTPDSSVKMSKFDSSKLASINDNNNSATSSRHTSPRALPPLTENTSPLPFNTDKEVVQTLLSPHNKSPRGGVALNPIGNTSTATSTNATLSSSAVELDMSTTSTSPSNAINSSNSHVGRVNALRQMTPPPGSVR